jgi:RNA polymerase sigma-70 factor (ECF subfamily)
MDLGDVVDSIIIMKRKTEVDPMDHDAELQAAVGGDTAARWRAIEACRDYLRLVARRGRWSNNNGGLATSDLVQKTMIDAWRGFSQFQGLTPGQLRAWMGAILVRQALNARRRPRVVHLESSCAAMAIADTTTSPSRACQKKSSREALDQALKSLSERHRMVIHMRLWDQLSFARIGTRLNLSEDAARMTFGRAVAKLNHCMGPGHDPR